MLSLFVEDPPHIDPVCVGASTYDSFCGGVIYVTPFVEEATHIDSFCGGLLHIDSFC